MDLSTKTIQTIGPGMRSMVEEKKREEKREKKREENNTEDDTEDNTEDNREGNIAEKSAEENKGKIVYRFRRAEESGGSENSGILYINLIERYSCLNNCVFCERPRTGKPSTSLNVYESYPGELFLEKTPLLEKIIEKIEGSITKEDRELCIVGLGEPLIYFPKVVQLIKAIKDNYGSKGIKTRINTSGLIAKAHPGIGNKTAAEMLANAGLDSIRISLNATSSTEYKMLCRPRYGGSFISAVEFMENCRKNSINTAVSFVVNFNDGRFKTQAAEDYIYFAKSLGFSQDKIIIREYAQRR